MRAAPLLLPFVLVSFAANSLITRHVVANDLLDPGLLPAVRFVSGAAALLLLLLVRRERLVVGRGNLLPALWLGAYAFGNSYGFLHIGAGAGTFVFYTSVLLALLVDDRVRTGPLPARRLVGAAVALAGIGVLASSSGGTVTLLGVLLLGVSGVAWGAYTVAGRGADDPRSLTSGTFAVLAAVLVLPAGAGFAAELQVTAAGVVWVVVLGAGTTALAYVAWYACQRLLTSSQAGLVQLVIPVLTTLGAVLLLGEELTGLLLVAAVVVGAGLWLARAVPARETPATAPPLACPA